MDPDEARRRILEELARSRYGGSEGIIGWVLARLTDLWRSLQESVGSGQRTGVALLIVLCALLLSALVLLLRRTGWVRRSGSLRASADLSAAPELSAARLRELAARAESRHQYDDAVVLALRAIVRDLQERTLLEVQEGTTAHEAALTAAHSFPAARTRLIAASESFDVAAYSSRPATARDAADVRQLAEYLREARPQLDPQTAEAPTPPPTGEVHA
ncbi:DUF4129 domain-containing protein [Brachybacterium sp. EF45031]|uniref:DUF4129 domain-containing protein n=1 Tax=Brachybacterium sillae TaxID=2810536 RepID=UPI00217DDBCB|nr:DUF4129 domain-containing protein [Brachybacterium sillae]MCS6711014.1 DUF4129 domain-containing protein [Brachybacterium sillae]